MSSESKEEPAEMHEGGKVDDPAAFNEQEGKAANEDSSAVAVEEEKGSEPSDKMDEDKVDNKGDTVGDDVAEQGEKEADDTGDNDARNVDNEGDKEVNNDGEEEQEEREEEEEQGEANGENKEEEEEDNDNASVRSIGTAESQTQNETKPKSRYAIPDYLDRSTINSIKSYLTDFDVAKAELDEDEIVQLMIKTDRNVEHRARYFTNPLDDIIDEDKMHKDFKREEEEYLVGHDFMKAMTSILNAKRRRALDKRSVNWVKRAAGLNRKDYHSPHSAVGRDDHESDDQGGSAPRRYTRGMAKTTRIKKQEEFHFKDNLGLKSLLDSIEELEPESGPYPVPFECSRARARSREREKSPRQSCRKKVAVVVRAESDDESLRLERERRTFDPVIMRPLVARISEADSLVGQSRNRNFIFGDNRDILVTKIIVNGENVSEDEEDKMSIRERKRELKRLRDRQYQKRRRDRKLAERGERKQMLPKGKFTTPIRSNKKKRSLDYGSETDEDNRPRRIRPAAQTTVSRSFPASSSRKRSLRGPVSLPLLDWQRRQIWTPGRRARRDDREVHASVTVPEHLKRSGIAYRLPPWESVNPASNISDQANHAEPQRNRHSDDIYASWCHKLINCLNGGARSWAIREFFYSDIDKPWYNANPFAKEVSKLGILPNTKLTRREWSVVRRMTRRRPRRFSKKFIVSQLKERNAFRDMIRKLQANPDEPNHTGYPVPAPIRVGATVTAYNKKFLILHRGVVLYHEPGIAKYLVQFERKELGHQMCSDFDVASHGVPDILMPAALSSLSGSPHDIGPSSLSETGMLPYGTSFGPLSVAKTKEAISCEKEVTNLLAGRQQILKPDSENNEDTARAALVEKVAERETLVSLMSIIDTATSRKAMLLDVMEKFSTLLVDRLPFGEGPPSNHVISGYFERHFAWLRANLEMTNRTLERAASFLRVMYNKAYASCPESTKARKEQIKKTFIETVLTQERRLCGGPPSSTLHWIAALHHGSNDVGNYLSSLVLQDNSQGKDDKQGSMNDSGPSDQDEFLKSRVAAAGSVLSVIGYCCGRAGESEITLPDGDPPLVDVVMASTVANLPPPEVSAADMDGVLQEAIAERAAAAQELKDAFALLGKEFTGLLFASRAEKGALTTGN